METAETAQDNLSLAEVGVVFEHMSAADIRRAEKIGAVLAGGIGGINGEDLLQITVEKLLSGKRRFPRGQHVLVVLKTAMHSEASNLRKAPDNARIDRRVKPVGHRDEDRQDCGVSVVDPPDTRTPEDAVAAIDEIEQIQSALQGDEELALIAMAWADGLRGKDAADAVGLDTKAYDAARKRLDRRLQEISRRAP